MVRRNGVSVSKSPTGVTARHLATTVLATSLLSLAGCTSVDQTFGLANTTTLSVAETPKADIGVVESAEALADAPIADDVASTVDEITEATPEQTATVASAATEESEAPASPVPAPAMDPTNEKTTTVASLPVPAETLTTERASKESAAPVLALREQPKRRSRFSLFDRRDDRSPQRAKRSRAKKSLESNVAALARAKQGVQKPKATKSRRRVAVIVPKADVEERKGFGLPGVRSRSSIFGIGRGDNEDGAFRVASAGGLARGASGSFVKQTPAVSTECFKPELVAALRRVERKFGQKVVVTSGYRSPKRNRRAGGAKGSKHMTCEAADIQVPGVSKGKLAAYLRSMPNRGGVGTYCHTKSVHYDVGSKRDWSWGCRRR